MYPKSLQELIDQLTILPGVGQKTAERYALHLLDSSAHDIEQLARSIIMAKKNTHYCKECGNLAEEDICEICIDPTRDKKIICVVANAKEVFAIEKTGEYKGVYHVLGGLISTKQGILPDDLNIEYLIKKAHNSEEIILALNASVEGEMTALYLAKKMHDIANVTRLGFGLSIGGYLDYTDDMTLIKAFEGRKKLLP